ncbi:MAG: hypothetical protein HOV80_04145 [Polyangiaceae bacterium]|nr:hypothetical protein [Polyangiaceae bacterium]
MTAEAMRGLVADFRRTTLRSATASGLVSEEALDEARRILASTRFERFDLAHRGGYSVSDQAVPERLASELAAIASEAAARPVSLLAHRWMRLIAGDYSLLADDEAWEARTSEEGVLDVTVDLSDVATGEAEVVFTHDGVAYFTVPQRPGQVGIAERSPTVGRYDRYLTHRVGAATVMRLRALFL